MRPTASGSAQGKPGRNLFIAGLALQSSVFIGTAGTMAILAREFATLDPIAALGNPSLLSREVAGALSPLYRSLAGNLAGILLMMTALWPKKLREPWAYSWSIAVGILLFPLGLPLLVFCLAKRREFPAKNPPAR